MEETRPPTITVAKGRAVSEPTAWESAAGSKPSAAMMEVISTARSRESAPSRIAGPVSIPSTSSSWMRVIMMTQYSMAMPNSATNPAIADTESGRPARNNPTTPPMAAKGTLTRINKAERAELKAAKRMKKIAPSVIGTTIIRRRVARCSFSKLPVHSSR